MALPQLSCTTANGDKLRGNLVAMDDKAKVAVIKECDEKSSLGSLHIINLNHTSDLDISQPPPSTTPLVLPDINLQKVQRRLNQNVEAKWRLVESQGVNVSEEAQQLFNSLSKVYNDTRWEDTVIVVLSDVRISPPYTEDSCSGQPSSSLLPRIKKQVTKFHEGKKTV